MRYIFLLLLTGAVTAITGPSQTLGCIHFALDPLSSIWNPRSLRGKPTRASRTGLSLPRSPPPPPPPLYAIIPVNLLQFRSENVERTAVTGKNSRFNLVSHASKPQSNSNGLSGNPGSSMFLRFLRSGTMHSSQESLNSIPPAPPVATTPPLIERRKEVLDAYLLVLSCASVLLDLRRHPALLLMPSLLKSESALWFHPRPNHLRLFFLHVRSRRLLHLKPSDGASKLKSAAMRLATRLT